MTPFTRNRRVRPADSGGELVSVLLAGGGTAGHVSPLLASADALRRRRPDLTVTALGTQTGLEARIVPARGYDLRFVPRVPLPRKPDANLVRFPGAPVSYTHLRAHETPEHLVCRLLLEKKKEKKHTQRHNR